MDMELLDRFIRLFRGRYDAYGSEEGSCVKQPLTRDVYADHLVGTTPMGVYPLASHNDQWWCVWGCSDIDIEDYEGACRLRDALEAGGIHAIVERSRSKGYHVWVFASSPVPASDMRRMLLAAHQVADYPAREVNPKQETLAPGQYGNYVRLPYPNHADMSAPNRRCLDSYGNPMTLQQFIEWAESHLNEPSRIAELASFYKEPPRPRPLFNADYQECDSLQDALRNTSARARVIWRDGPLPGRDRSTTLARLAYECRDSGLNPSETKVVVSDADRRWGKFFMRTDGELQIDRLISRVYK